MAAFKASLISNYHEVSYKVSPAPIVCIPRTIFSNWRLSRPGCVFSSISVLTCGCLEGCHIRSSWVKCKKKERKNSAWNTYAMVSIYYKSIKLNHSHWVKFQCCTLVASQAGNHLQNRMRAEHTYFSTQPSNPIEKLYHKSLLFLF